MSDVKRWYIGIYDGEAQARVCAPHPHELIRDTEGEIFVIAEQFDACEARNRALQQRLTAADERADVLEGLVGEVLDTVGREPLDLDAVLRLRARMRAALKPAEVSQ